MYTIIRYVYKGYRYIHFVIHVLQFLYVVTVSDLCTHWTDYSPDCPITILHPQVTSNLVVPAVCRLLPAAVYCVRVHSKGGKKPELVCFLPSWELHTDLKGDTVKVLIIFGLGKVED